MYPSSLHFDCIERIIKAEDCLEAAAVRGARPDERTRPMDTPSPPTPATPDPGMPALSATRVVIRRFRHEDAEPFAAYRSHPSVARYQSWTPPVSVDVAREMVAEFQRGDPTAPGWYQYAISLSADGPIVGDIGVFRYDNHLQADIGFTLAAEFHGRGYATEAVGRLVQHLFTDRGLHRLSAQCDSRNVNSARLLRKLGFAQEGFRRQNSRLKGEWTDDVLFGLLAQDWRTHQGPPGR